MHLVDEEDVAVVEVREDGGEIAGPFERGTAGGVQPRAHLVGDDPGQARLAEAGRTGEQDVVDGLPALLGRGEHDLEVLAQTGLADEFAEMARPECRLLRDLGFVGLGTQQLFPHLAARQEPQRVAQELFDRPVLTELTEHLAHLVVAVAEADERVAHLGARVRRGRARHRGEIEIGHVEPGLQVDEQPLGGALADAGHGDEGVEVVFGETAAEARSASAPTGSRARASGRRRSR